MAEKLIACKTFVLAWRNVLTTVYTAPLFDSYMRLLIDQRLVITTVDRHTPLPKNLPAKCYTVPRVRPGCHPGHGTTCSGYKHFILIDEKTSLPLSVRGAYIATTAPYLNIWCLQYFPLIQRRQRNRHISTYLFIAKIKTPQIHPSGNGLMFVYCSSMS